MFAILAAMPLMLLLGAAAPPSAVQYAADGQLKLPENYREWVFLSSGLGMTYGPAAEGAETRPPMFDNVFVNPESYRAFLETGKWPDKTLFVLEIRASASHVSINKTGHSQGEVIAIEAEVKDSSKPGLWTFYEFPGGKAFPRTASCYECHGKNAAVENTFVQFYPTLYPVAEKKGTVNPGFKK